MPQRPGDLSPPGPSPAHISPLKNRLSCAKIPFLIFKPIQQAEMLHIKEKLPAKKQTQTEGRREKRMKGQMKDIKREPLLHR
ncbi:hypothetical protein CLOM621_09012 [Clostridium sp. M62/1]|nr:hypothetical protein CLOM621_09012 [Clostridium sp. M62/1]